ncbi:MAG TPA: fumarylacetoacetate hydrolase family protein [Gemmataceae bacterium]|nr:fumarylacetoacetate hydrolase family protein [Gemmataceae bacterium]
MRLVKFRRPNAAPEVGVLDGDRVRPIDLSRAGAQSLADLLATADPASAASLGLTADAIALGEVTLLPPVDAQEVWAAGVTYLRSKKAREDESAGAARFYDLVYTASRPELFFKATPDRVVGPGQPIRVRADSRWSVPEPELAVVVSPDLRIVGYTIGNDMSARDIEGENPLYLPQAKVYKQSCALGPCVTLAMALPPRDDVGIRLRIDRGGAVAFAGETSLARMARPLEELVDWLGRENEFPNGVILLTGTGIVPPDEFSLQAGDVVSIAIDGVGELINPVVCGP